MAATALIKFTQGVVVGNGQAISGVVGVQVNVANVDNTDVLSWRIDLLDVPSSSALVPGLLAQGNSATPAASFTPDVRGGCYRVQLTVWPQTAQGGTPDVDIRNVIVLDEAGFATPPSQVYPPPLPPPASAAAGNKPDELNVGGQTRGWAGAGTDGLLDHQMRFPRQAQALRETGGPTVLPIGAVAEGEIFRRTNGSVVGTSYPAGAVAAGTQTATGTVVFANSNGLTFGMSGSSQVTGSYTVPVVPPQSTAPAAISAGGAQATSGTVVFGNANGLSFGMNAGTVTGSYTVPSVPAQTNQTIGVYGVGNTTGESSSSTADARTVSVRGAGIASVGWSNSSLVVSVPSPPAQTVQTQNVVVPSAGTQTATSGTVVFSDSNNVTFGMSGSTRITASIPAGATATGNLGAAAAGTQTATSGTVVFSDSNGVSFGMSGSTRVTASVAAGATATGNFGALAGGTQTATSGTVVFSDSNGISFGMSGSTRVTASYTVPTVPAQLSVGLSNVGNTSGDTGVVTARLVLAGGNNVTLSGSTNGGSMTITISGPAPGGQTNQTGGIYALGNTTGQSSSSTYDARTLSIEGAGAVSVGWSNSSLRISAPTQTVQTQNVVVPSAGTQTATSGTVVFSDSNGVSFGMSGSTRVTASVAAGATATGNLGAIAGGTQTATSGTIVFSDSNGVSFGLSGSTRMTASVAAGATATGNLGALAAGTQTATSGTLVFSDSNGISFGMSGSTRVTASYTVPTVPAQLSVGLSNVGNTAGDTGVVTGRLVLAGGNNVTVSGSTNGGSMTVTISGPNTAAQSVQTIGLYAVSNTTGQSSSSTFDARTISFQGAGIASVGYSNGSVIISVPAGGGAGDGVNIIAAGTQTAATTGTVLFQNSNGVTFGMSNSSVVTASVSAQTEGLYAVGNTTGQSSSSTFDPRTLSYQGAGDVSIGYSNGSVIVSGGMKLAHYEPFPMLQSGSTTYAPGAGTWHFDPFVMPGIIGGGRVNVLVSFNSNASAGGILVPTSSASFASGTTGSRSISYSYVKSIALYSLGAGTNSTRLESIWSNTYSVGINHSVSVASGGATSLSVTNAATLSYIASIDSLGAYTTTTLASSTQRTTGASTMDSSGVTAALSSLVNILSGQFAIPVGFNTTLTPGQYWLAQAWSSASTTGGTAGHAFSFVNQQALYGISSMPWRVWGGTASSTGSQIYPGQGIYSAASGAPPATVAFSDIRSIASHIKNYFNIVNSTI